MADWEIHEAISEGLTSNPVRSRDIIQYLIKHPDPDTGTAIFKIVSNTNLYSDLVRYMATKNLISEEFKEEAYEYAARSHDAIHIYPIESKTIDDAELTNMVYHNEIDLFTVEDWALAGQLYPSEIKYASTLLLAHGWLRSDSLDSIGLMYDIFHIDLYTDDVYFLEGTSFTGRIFYCDEEPMFELVSTGTLIEKIGSGVDWENIAFMIDSIALRGTQLEDNLAEIQSAILIRLLYFQKRSMIILACIPLEVVNGIIRWFDYVKPTKDHIKSIGVIAYQQTYLKSEAYPRLIENGYIPDTQWIVNTHWQVVHSYTFLLKGVPVDEIAEYEESNGLWYLMKLAGYEDGKDIFFLADRKEQFIEILSQNKEAYDYYISTSNVIAETYRYFKLSSLYDAKIYDYIFYTDMYNHFKKYISKHVHIDGSVDISGTWIHSRRIESIRLCENVNGVVSTLRKPYIDLTKKIKELADTYRSMSLVNRNIGSIVSRYRDEVDRLIKEIRDHLKVYTYQDVDSMKLDTLAIDTLIEKITSSVSEIRLRNYIGG
jgi:hypothetical protein